MHETLRTLSFIAIKIKKYFFLPKKKHNLSFTDIFLLINELKNDRKTKIQTE